jgi:hypothetical protein
MGKVRPAIPNDIEAMTQWIGRKLCNHNPMQHRDLHSAKQSFLPRDVAKGQNLRDQVESPKAGAWVVDEGERNAVLYKMANGRRFTITINEVAADEEPPPLKSVGL